MGVSYSLEAQQEQNCREQASHCLEQSRQTDREQPSQVMYAEREVEVEVEVEVEIEMEEVEVEGIDLTNPQTQQPRVW